MKPVCLLDYATATDAVQRFVGRTGGAIFVMRQAETELRVREVSRVALSLFDSGEGTDRFYWEHPAETFAIGALGCVERIAPDGSAVRRFLERVTQEQAVGGPDLPILVGGFPFSPDQEVVGPRPGFVLPEQMVIVRGAQVEILSAVSADPAEGAEDVLNRLHRLADRTVERIDRGQFESSSSPARQYSAVTTASDRESYRQGVEQILAAISRGELEKAVLSRRLKLRSSIPYDPVAVLGALRKKHRHAAIFGLGCGSEAFVGATPERLVALEDQEVRLLALAGSAPCCGDAARDAEWARSLRESKKEQAEHAAVVRAIRPVLEETCDRLEIPEAPKLLVLDGIQHLQTPMCGTLRGKACSQKVVDLARRLHPTPAVAGTPTQPAVEFLRSLEGESRGWYAGGVGFVDCRGSGEVWVALRCASLSGNRATLYAGSGIVAGSEPMAEWEETEVKLQAIRTVLGGNDG